MEEEVPLDVLVYIGNVRQYLETNEQAYKYFIGEFSEETFFSLLKDVAMLNFLKKGEPQLSQEQFEFLRVSVNVFSRVDQDEMPQDSIYEYIPNHLKFYIK
jgi:hypothetical protein